MPQLNLVLLAWLCALLHISPCKGQEVYRGRSSNEWSPSLAVIEETFKETLIKTRREKQLAILSAGVILLIVSGFLFLTHQRSRLLRRQFRIIIAQRAVVESKQREILDSLMYAENIQSALLRNERKKTSLLPPHFIFFRPKDIVSGDFYWVMEKKGYLYVASSDCTGHGAAGAFLTLLGNSFLNEINSTGDVLAPSSILEIIRQKFISKLGSTALSMDMNFGMDISLARIHLDTLELVWAGANLPCYIVRSGDQSESGFAELVELRGDRQPIGYHPRQDAFTDHHFDLLHGDRLYLPTDGLFSQFGGPRGKKFQSAQLKSVLLDLVSYPMDQQEELLAKVLDEWKGSNEQVDDICLIGLEVIQYVSHVRWHLVHPEECDEPDAGAVAGSLESAA